MNSASPLYNVLVSLRQAAARLATENAASKNAALAGVAAALNRDREAILAANACDVRKARGGGMKESLVDRLYLDRRRIDGIIDGVNVVIAQKDPVGTVKAGWTLPNGLLVEQVTVPLGVAAIIYESRPNVTVDCAALAYKAGCPILLRGSSSALESNRAIVASIKSGLQDGGGIAEAVALADAELLYPDSPGTRRDVDEILTARGMIDVVLPRGGGALIRHVVENARVPVIETGEGNCHVYVEPGIDMENAADIIANAKLQRPGVCNAAETLLVHRNALADLVPPLLARLAGKVELRCDAEAKAVIEKCAGAAGVTVKAAVEDDWASEFLDTILAVKTVGGCAEAVAHVNRYGTGHSEAILTGDLASARRFQSEVDAACVYVNASTRFTDGGMFGFGAELGISTQKFHARGPMGLEALTTVKYLISGSGQIRE